MTISNTTSKIIYTGNGSTDTYTFPFKITATTDLVVTQVTISSGAEATLTNPADYTLALDGDLPNTGTITLTAGNLSSSYKLVIERSIAQTQSTDLQPNDDLPADTIESMVDRNTMMIQEISTKINRAILQHITATAQISLPDLSLHSGKFLKSDGSTLDFGTPSNVTYSGTITFGTDASKASSPGSGDIHISSDTKIVYFAYASGTWTAIQKMDSLLLGEQSSDPTTGTNEGAIYTKDVSGTTELFYRDQSSGNVIQLTSGGALNASTGLPKGYMDGGIISNNTTDATNDLDITATKCRDADDTVDLSVSAMTKRVDATWTAGDNGGGLDTGTIGASEDLIYIWAISKAAGADPDFLFSKSNTSPTMPTDYTKKRLLGGRRWDGAAWSKFRTKGAGVCVEVWYDNLNDADLAVVNAGTDTSFTDVDCGDGGAEVYPSTAQTAILTIQVLSVSIANLGAQIRANGDTGSGDAYNAFQAESLGTSAPRLRGHGEITLDSDGIFEYSKVSGDSVTLYAKGFKEVR